MSTDLVVPGTGELIDLSAAPDEGLGAVYDRLNELSGEIRLARAAIATEMNRRMDENAKWTVHAGGFKLTGQAPGRIQYDAQKLAETVDRLVANRLISTKAGDAAVEWRMTHTVHAAGVNALRKLGGEVQAAIDECAEPVEGARRLTVTREGT